MRALFILPNPNGTCRVHREPSWNTPDNMPNQLAKFNMDTDALPVPPIGVPERYWAWDGTAIVECSQAVKDVIAAADADAALVEAERLNTPIVQDQPLEIPSLVLQSYEAGIGVGVVADDAGELATFIYHASPVPDPAEINARKDAAVARNAARKAARESVGTQAQVVKGAAAAANSVPRLREQVAALAEQVQALTEAIIG